jgi:phosphatidylinositol-bisphosphatase
MKVSPTYGMLIPGEESVTVEFTLAIDNVTAQNLNSGREVLDDILILRLEGGRDYYITVKASYARSCFGMSAEELVMYTGPVRSIPIDPIQRTEKLGPHVSSALSVPKELWRLIDAVHNKGIHTPGLFVESGIADEVNRIRECLDTESAFGQFRIQSYAEALVAFLSSMSSPIVPSKMFPSVEIDSQNIQSSARRFLEDLTPIHYNAFVYVISFFRQVLTAKNQNQLTSAKAARICVRCMAPGHGLDDSATSLQKRAGVQLLMMHFLETSSI